MSIISELFLIFKDLIHGIEHVWIYFAAGVAIEALIRTFKWHVKIRKALNRFGVLSILFATLLGMLSPLCACGTLPLIVSLLVAGLPLAPAMALLVSAPLMSPAGVVITQKLLGFEWVAARVGAALFMGIFAGLVTHLLKDKGFGNFDLFKEKIPEGNFHDPDYPDERLRCFCGEQFSNRLARKTDNKFLIFLAKAYEGAVKIGKFVLIGIVVEVLATRYIPHDWITAVLTSTNPAVVPAIALATIPMHINQFTAVEFLWGVTDLLKDTGGTLSNSVGLAFLVGGPVTAIPAMAVFLSLFKKRVFFLYLALCVSGTVICAYAYQLLS